MKQDKMYTKKEQTWGRELYGDELYTPDSSKFKTDSDMFSKTVINDYSRYVDPDNQNDNFKQMIERDLRFQNFSVFPYFKFCVALDARYNSIPFTSQCFDTMIVEKTYILKDSPHYSLAYLFIPLNKISEIVDYDDYVLIDKLFIYNTSNPLANSVITGQFKTPVAVTRDRYNRFFDHDNCEVYNDDWMIIKVTAPSHNFKE